MPEKDYYKSVELFLRKKLDCFTTHQTIGLGVDGVTGNIDVVGIRHVGGDLRGDIEIIAVEVKDDEPYLKSSGQALAYGVMAHRCYLACEPNGKEGFNAHQRRVAEHFKIGLLSLSKTGRGVSCKEVQSAPHTPPDALMAGELVERLGYAQCTVCRSYFQISDERGRRFQDDKVTRGSDRRDIGSALETETGFVYWLRHVEKQRRDQRTKKRADSIYCFDRRFACITCIDALGFGRLGDDDVG